MSNIIKMGVTDLSFHRVTASIIRHVLQDMGFEVERIYSPHQENFLKLKSGEIDMLASAWLPSSHGIYQADVETAAPLLELGLHYQPYALWGVPDYVPADTVSAVSDLLKPEVIRQMNKDIQGINPGAGITRFSIQMMESYGLSQAGYQFHTGTEEDCFTAFERAVEKKEWLVVPLWKPQFLHHKFVIREIVEPKGLLGIVDKAILLLRQDRSAAFTQSQLERLDTLRFSNEIIAKLDYQVCREGHPLDLVTRTWLDQHPAS
ncbi:glycine betaine ABC transporter substrate-binding protein [Marinomonas pollencensis]|uniref:Glycine betaine/proline transport system substrate-binding protein n=1 Tax=Marinomonas pollencensis TaxID=491954 RepID=A0A3E0DA48_9GAMM|nr:glycine betaine ABC transporter substrate-binding protein [Marinomonas pollencensis]REG79550.1 glycine betaine/proline transport system substrate-binding protein [Marinomonas pollencensis]